MAAYMLKMSPAKIQYQRKVVGCTGPRRTLPSQKDISKALFLVQLIFFEFVNGKPNYPIEEFISKPISRAAQEPTGQALVDYLNKWQSFFKGVESTMHSTAPCSPTWVGTANLSSLSAEQQLARAMKIEYLKERNRTGRKYRRQLTPRMNFVANFLPERFDAREAWPYCPSVRHIRDQSNCGSCWAVSAASTMSDRLCIRSGGRQTTILSDTDILACSGWFNGCNGGYPISAWNYAVRNGVCSGGHYGEKGVCKPYVFPPCGRHANQAHQCQNQYFPTPVCVQYCQYGYGIPYLYDKVYAETAYFVYGYEWNIQYEILTRGPVQATFMLYEDLIHYKSGIYVHTAGRALGGHVVKIVGWGVESGIKYWTIANSWNTDWGEDGFFRILRGVNHLGIEGSVVAGLVKPW